MRKVSKATYLLPNDGFPNSFFVFYLTFSGKKLDSDTDATADEASFKVTIVNVSLLLYRPSVVTSNTNLIYEASCMESHHLFHY